MRPKIDYRTVSRQAYQELREQYPSLNITYKQYTNVIYEINTAISDFLIETGQKVSLPYGCGDLSIVKYKPLKYKKVSTINGTKTIINLPVNWELTRKNKKIIYHLNAHTDGYKFRIRWFNDVCRFQHKKLFNFKSCRKTARKLAQVLKEKCRSHEIYSEYR